MLHEENNDCKINFIIRGLFRIELKSVSQPH